jgi:hypothetical protein
VYPGAGGAGARFVVFEGRVGNLRVLAPAARAPFDAEEPILKGERRNAFVERVESNSAGVYSTSMIVTFVRGTQARTIHSFVIRFIGIRQVP